MGSGSTVGERRRPTFVVFVSFFAPVWHFLFKDGRAKGPGPWVRREDQMGTPLHLLWERRWGYPWTWFGSAGGDTPGSALGRLPLDTRVSGLGSQWGHPEVCRGSQVGTPLDLRGIAGGIPLDLVWECRWEYPWICFGITGGDTPGSMLGSQICWKVRPSRPWIIWRIPGEVDLRREF